jgi:hypothetical protein
MSRVCHLESFWNKLKNSSQALKDLKKASRKLLSQEYYLAGFGSVWENLSLI